MKTQSAVLFTVICLFACCTHRQTLPVVVKTEDKKVNDGLSWPNVEYNRYTRVVIEFHYFMTQLGRLEVVHEHGVVVGPRTIITRDFASLFVPPDFLLQGVTVRSVYGGWSGMPASIIMVLKEDDGVMLLSTNEDMPNMVPAVFGGISYGGAVGYVFDEDRSLKGPEKTKVTPVLVSLSADGKRCKPEKKHENILGNGDMLFDMKHRLVCVSRTSAQKVERFLRANGISVVTN